MTENSDEMKTLVENPALFQTFLNNGIEEIVADIRRNEYESEANVIPRSEDNDKKNVLEDILNVIVQLLHSQVDNMWEDGNIENLMADLQRLRQEYAGKGDAWRPTTGEIPLTNLEGKYLTKTKERLIKKIENSRLEAEKLKTEIQDKRNDLRSHLEDVNKSKASLQGIMSLYQELQ